MILMLSLPGAATGAAAEPAASDVKPAAPAWTVTLGVEGRLEPVFQGSDRYEVLPYPLFRVRRAGTPERFSAPRDSFSIGIYDLGYVRAGAVGRLRRAREQSSDPALNGLGDVDWVAEIGGFLDYWWTPWLRSRVEVRQGLGGHDGIVSDLTLDAVVPLAPQLTLSGGPRLTLATAAAIDPYFSINDAQSAASGLPVYDAKGGVQSLGAGLKARYWWNPSWAVHASVEYERLTASVGHAPLVEQRGSPDQFTFAFGTTYSFDIHQFW